MAKKRFLHIHMGIALICCFFMIVVLACVPKAPPKERPATLTVQPSSGKAASPLVIQGSQFLPGEEVEIILQVGDVYHSLGTAKAEVIVADKNGAFATSSGIPVRTPEGTYKIEAVGNKGSVGVFNITVVK